MQSRVPQVCGIIAFVLALVFSSYPALAQTSFGQISGTVLDSTGATLPGAKVTATNVGTNVAHDTTSDATGNYVIPLLQPGDYVVTVEAPGFKNIFLVS